MSARKPLEEKISRVPTTIMACCVLHNISIDVGDPSAIDPVEDDDEMDQSSFNGDEQLCARNIRYNEPFVIVQSLNQFFFSFYWNILG